MAQFTLLKGPEQGKGPMPGSGAGTGNGFKAFNQVARSEHLACGGRLGLLTGQPSRVVVVDFDPKDYLPGETTVSKRIALGLEQATHEVSTPSAGVHLYYRCEDDPELLALTSRIGVLAPGVDFKGDRGYVVFPTPGSGYEVVDARKAIEAPESLKAWMRETLHASTRRSAATKARTQTSTHDVCCADGRALADDALEETLAEAADFSALVDGETMWLPSVQPRNAEEVGWDSGFWLLASRMVEIATWAGFDLVEVEEAFTDLDPGGEFDFAHAWEQGVENAGEWYEGRQHELEHQTSVLSLASLGLSSLNEAVRPAEATKQVQGSGMVPTDLFALLDPARPPRVWFWDQVVPLGDQVSIVAPAGTGKSLLALALSVEAIRGRETFIGRRVMLPAANRVVYIDMENSDDDLIERFASLGVTREETLEWDGRLVLFHLPRLGGLDTEAGSATLMAALDEVGAIAGDVLVLDSTQRVVSGPENDSDTFRALYDHTALELKRRGLTVIRTDNMGWPGDKAVADMHERGSSSKRDDVGYSWKLTSLKENRFELTNAKRRSGGNLSDTIRFDRVSEEGRLEFRQVIVSVEDPDTENTNRARLFKAAVVEILRIRHDAIVEENRHRSDPQPTYMRQSELLSALREAGQAVRAERRIEWLADLVEDGYLETEGGDRKIKADGTEGAMTTKFYGWVKGLPEDFSGEDDSDAY